MDTSTTEIIGALSRKQRLELLEKLWDSLAEEDLPITEDLRAELDRRLEDLDQNPGDAEPWEDVRERLLSLLK